MELENFRPLKGKTVVKVINEDMSEGGIFLRNPTTYEVPTRGLVLKTTCDDVKVGDVIIYEKYAGNDLSDYKGECIASIRNEHIQCVLEN